jgi:hypothetical protein
VEFVRSIPVGWIACHQHQTLIHASHAKNVLSRNRLQLLCVSIFKTKSNALHLCRICIISIEPNVENAHPAGPLASDFQHQLPRDLGDPFARQTHSHHCIDAPHAGSILSISYEMPKNGSPSQVHESRSIKAAAAD